MDDQKIYFAGDHNGGLHPKVIEAISHVNVGKAASYMEDMEFKKMNDNFNQIFDRKVKTLMFNTGTAANIVAISSMVKPFNSVICPKTTHINSYEAGGPSRFCGCTLDPLPTKDGKITIDQIDEVLEKREKINIFVQPKAVFITQPTDFGTLWTLKELRELSEYCKGRGLYLAIDGARIANAVEKTGIDIKKMTVDIGVDIMTWGGIKNGGLADVLIIFNEELSKDIDFIFKQIGQDVAKSRFYAATVNALLENELWLKNAHNANSMADNLYEKIKNNKKIEITLPVTTNFIWAITSKDQNEKLWQRFVYYLETNDLEIEKYKKYFVFARWVTSWATTEEEVNLFAEAINSL